MSRVIKFRAWDKEEKEMLRDISTFTDDYTDMLNETFRYWQDPEIDTDLIIMQFTGLLDKNGKEIYEGDIIRWGNDLQEQEICTIVYDAPSFVLEETLGNKDRWDQFDHRSLEIIGNIFENPDLIDNKT